jgi:hypothetical protein
MTELRYSQPKLLLYSVFAIIGMGIGFGILGGFVTFQMRNMALICGPLMIFGFGFAAYHLLDTAFGDLSVVEVRNGRMHVTTVFDRYVFPVSNIEQIGLEIVEGDGTKDECVVIRVKERVKNERGWFSLFGTQKITLPTRMMESFDAASLGRLQGGQGRLF